MFITVYIMCGQTVTNPVLFTNFRLTIAEEGCARILNHRSSSHTLVQLCRALGSDETGIGSFSLCL